MRLEWQSYRFEDPWLLLLALIVPALVILNLVRQGRPQGIGFTRVAALAHLGGMRRALRWLPFAFRCMAILLVVLAIARPQEGRADASVPSEGIDVVLVIDVSASMEQRDMPGQRTRMAVAQETLRKFVERQKDDRIGLVAFQSESRVLSPVTLDHDPLLRLVTDAPKLPLGGGTAIGMGTADGVNLLVDSRSKSRAVVVLTDGENNSGSIEPLQAARLAEAVGVRLYTIGIQGPGVNEVDEATTKKMAEIGGGYYSRAESQEDLERIYNRIGELEKSRVTRDRFQFYDELAPYALAAAAAAVLIEVLLRSFVFRRIP